jgi:hypothetical protein
MPRARSWTDDQLRDAVAASTTLAEVHRRLGLEPGKYAAMLRHIRRLGLDTSHIDLTPRSRRRGQWTDGDLTAVVARVATVSDVLRELGYAPSGGMHRYIRARIAHLGLDTSHFTGRGSTKGRTFPPRPRRPLEELLVQGSVFGSGKLRLRLIRAGLKDARCEACGLTEWMGQAIPLQLDHINGDHTDNRLENLRILCGNCHSQTETWCARGRKA